MKRRHNKMLYAMIIMLGAALYVVEAIDNKRKQ